MDAAHHRIFDHSFAIAGLDILQVATSKAERLNFGDYGDGLDYGDSALGLR